MFFSAFLTFSSVPPVDFSGVAEGRKERRQSRSQDYASSLSACTTTSTNADTVQVSLNIWTFPCCSTMLRFLAHQAPLIRLLQALSLRRPGEPETAWFVQPRLEGLKAGLLPNWGLFYLRQLRQVSAMPLALRHPSAALAAQAVMSWRQPEDKLLGAQVLWSLCLSPSAPLSIWLFSSNNFRTKSVYVI